MVASPSTLPAHRLRTTLDPLIRKAATQSRADRYRKRFSARAHLWMLLIHTMSGGKSLRQSHARLCADPALLGMLGMEEPISLSQLARSSSSRSADCFELMLASLLGKARAERAKGASVAGLRAGEVELLDSTFLFLGARRSPWARHGRHPAGVRVQTAFDLLREVPSAIEMTTVSANDAKALSGWDLSALKGKTLLFDLGYYSHARASRGSERAGCTS